MRREEMPVTSLKLSDQLKERVQSLVTGTGRTAHAFMIEAIERAAQAEELRRRFGEEAAAAERETLKSGKAYDAREVFSYLEARSRGKRVSRPRAASWRKSG
jgi:predicted transcriptional regulator